MKTEKKFRLIIILLTLLVSLLAILGLYRLLRAALFGGPAPDATLQAAQEDVWVAPEAIDGALVSDSAYDAPDEETPRPVEEEELVTIPVDETPEELAREDAAE